MRHHHHITPRHIGGTDDPSNIVELTVTQHAMFHYANWQLWKREQDFIAWKAISGIASNEEVVKMALSLGGKKGQETLRQRGFVIPRTSESCRLGGLVSGPKIGAMCRDQKKGVCAPGVASLGGQQIRGKLWWTNGDENKRCFDCPGDGWRRGRNKMSNETKEKIRKAMKGKPAPQRANKQRYRCLVTGFESTAGPLSLYQRKRGINTSLRELAQ